MTQRTVPIKIQERDLAMLRGLFESRIMTAAHVADLFFEGRKEAAKKRLQKLKAAGLIGERPRRASDPALLFVTRRSLKLLENEGALADYPSLSLLSLEKRVRVSELTVRHELHVMDVKAAFHRAFRRIDRFRICGICKQPNRDGATHSFLDRCGHEACGIETKTYKCHHCGDLIYLNLDIDEIEAELKILYKDKPQILKVIEEAAQAAREKIM